MKIALLVTILGVAVPTAAVAQARGRAPQPPVSAAKVAQAYEQATDWHRMEPPLVAAS